MDELAPEESAHAGNEHEAVPDAMASLARGVAHDFNNLLLAMMLYADLVAWKAGDGEGAAEAREIRRAVDRGCRLTRQLQSYAGSDPLSADTLDLGELLRQLEPRLRHVLGPDIALDMRLDGGVLWPVNADAAHLKEAFLALAGEIGIWMGKGGTMVLDVGNRSQDGFIAIGVEGDGARLPPAATQAAFDPARVFEPYYISRTLGAGSGLGLAACRTVVERAGGALELERWDARGMRFTLRLPRWREL